MTRALAVRGPVTPAQASGRMKKAAEHYVRNGCKHIRPSLIYAGYAPSTADEPTKNNLTHDRLVKVASYWNKGSQETARSHLSMAIATLAGIAADPQEPAVARAGASKIIIDVSVKEAASDDKAVTSDEEQARWMSLIRHWKRTFLRRGILLGRDSERSYYSCRKCPDRRCNCERNWTRAEKLLKELNYALGKGPRPAWYEGEDESILGLKGDPRHGTIIDAEVVEEPRVTITITTTSTWTSPTDPQ